MKVPTFPLNGRWWFRGVWDDIIGPYPNEDAAGRGYSAYFHYIEQHPIGVRPCNPQDWS